MPLGFRGVPLGNDVEAAQTVMKACLPACSSCCCTTHTGVAQRGVRAERDGGAAGCQDATEEDAEVHVLRHHPAAGHCRRDRHRGERVLASQLVGGCHVNLRSCQRLNRCSCNSCDAEHDTSLPAAGGEAVADGQVKNEQHVAQLSAFERPLTWSLSVLFPLSANMA